MVVTLEGMGDRQARREELLRELEALDRVKDEPRRAGRSGRREPEWFDAQMPGRSMSRRGHSRGRRVRSPSARSQSRYVRRSPERAPREPKREHLPREPKRETRAERSRSRRAGSRAQRPRDVLPPRDVSPEFRAAPRPRCSRSPSQRRERRSVRYHDEPRLPPPVGRMIVTDAPRGRSPESKSPPRQRELAEFNASPTYQPRIDHYRWNVIENDPGWSITASVWGPPKPTLSDHHGKISVMWIFDSKRKGWKIHEIVEGHPSNKYGQFTPDAVRRPAPAPRPVPRAPGAGTHSSSRTVKKEEVKREPDGSGEQVKREQGGDVSV